jgi:CheY-like chemotaxis protein
MSPQASHQPARRRPLWRERHDAPTFLAGEQPGRVLVVEDDPVQALLLQLMLKHLGVASTLVTDGAQAIEAVKKASYALVLMDYLMPGINGVEATRSIRCWEREAGRAPTPIAAVTASGMTDEQQRYFEAGMNDVVLKPFSASALAALVARYGPTGSGAHTDSLNTPGTTS